MVARAPHRRQGHLALWLTLLLALPLLPLPLATVSAAVPVIGSPVLIVDGVDYTYNSVTQSPLVGTRVADGTPRTIGARVSINHGAEPTATCGLGDLGTWSKGAEIDVFNWTGDFDQRWQPLTAGTGDVWTFAATAVAGFDAAATFNAAGEPTSDGGVDGVQTVRVRAYWLCTPAGTGSLSRADGALAGTPLRIDNILPQLPTVEALQSAVTYTPAPELKWGRTLRNVVPASPPKVTGINGTWSLLVTDNNLNPASELATDPGSTIVPQFSVDLGRLVAANEKRVVSKGTLVTFKVNETTDPLKQYDDNLTSQKAELVVNLRDHAGNLATRTLTLRLDNLRPTDAAFQPYPGVGGVGARSRLNVTINATSSGANAWVGWNWTDLPTSGAGDWVGARVSLANDASTHEEWGTAERDAAFSTGTTNRGNLTVPTKQDVTLRLDVIDNAGNARLGDPEFVGPAPVVYIDDPKFVDGASLNANDLKDIKVVLKGPIVAPSPTNYPTFYMWLRNSKGEYWNALTNGTTGTGVGGAPAFTAAWSNTNPAAATSFVRPKVHPTYTGTTVEYGFNNLSKPGTGGTRIPAAFPSDTYTIGVVARGGGAASSTPTRAGEWIYNYSISFRLDGNAPIVGGSASEVFTNSITQSDPFIARLQALEGTKTATDLATRNGDSGIEFINVSLLGTGAGETYRQQYTAATPSTATRLVVSCANCTNAPGATLPARTPDHAPGDIKVPPRWCVRGIVTAAELATPPNRCKAGITAANPFDGVLTAAKPYADNGLNRTFTDGSTADSGGNIRTIFTQYNRNGRTLAVSATNNGPFGYVEIPPESWKVPVGRHKIQFEVEDKAGNVGKWVPSGDDQYLVVKPRIFPLGESPAVLANGKLYMRFGASYDNRTDTSGFLCDSDPATAGQDYVCPLTEFRFEYKVGNGAYQQILTTSVAGDVALGPADAYGNRPRLYNYSLEGTPITAAAGEPVRVRVTAVMRPEGTSYEFTNQLTDVLARKAGEESPVQIKNVQNPAQPYAPWNLWPNGTANYVRFNATIEIDSFATTLDVEGTNDYKMPVAVWTIQNLSSKKFVKIDDPTAGFLAFPPTSTGDAPTDARMVREVNLTKCILASCGGSVANPKYVEPKRIYNFSAPYPITAANPFKPGEHWANRVNLPDGEYLLNVTFYRNKDRMTSNADVLGRSVSFAYFAIESDGPKVETNLTALDPNRNLVTQVVDGADGRKFVKRDFNLSLDVRHGFANLSAFDVAKDFAIERLTYTGTQQRFISHGEAGAEIRILNQTAMSHLGNRTWLNLSYRLPTDARPDDRFRIIVNVTNDLATWGATINGPQHRTQGPTPQLIVTLDGDPPYATWDATAQGANATGLRGARTANYRGDALEWVVFGEATDTITPASGAPRVGSGVKDVQVRITDLTRGLTWNNVSGGWNAGSNLDRWYPARVETIGGTTWWRFGESPLARRLAKDSTDGTDVSDAAAYPGVGGLAALVPGGQSLNLSVTLPATTGASSTVSGYFAIRARNDSSSAITVPTDVSLYARPAGGSETLLGTFTVGAGYAAYNSNALTLTRGVAYNVRLEVKGAAGHEVAFDVLDVFASNGLRRQLDTASVYQVEVRGSDRVGNPFDVRAFPFSFDAAGPTITNVRYYLPAVPANGAWPAMPVRDLGTTQPAGQCVNLATNPPQHSPFRCVSWYGLLNGTLHANFTIADDNCVARADLVVRMPSGWVQRETLRDIGPDGCRAASPPPLPAWARACAVSESTMKRISLGGCKLPGRLMNESGSVLGAKANYIYVEAWDGVGKKNLSLGTPHRYRVIDDHPADLVNGYFVPGTAGAGGVSTLNVEVFEDYKMGNVSATLYRNRPDSTYDETKPLGTLYGEPASDAKANGTGRWLLRTSALPNFTLEVGNYTAVVFVRDAALHGESTCVPSTTNCNGFLLLVREGAAPTLSVESPTDSAQFVNGTFRFHAIAYSNRLAASGVALKVGNSTTNLTQATPETKVELLNGKPVALHIWHNATLATDEVPLNLSLKVTDNTGLSDSITRGWKIDVTPPTAEGAFDVVKEIDDKVYVRSTAKFSVNATDTKSGVATVSCRVNGEARDCSAPISLTGADGTYTVAYSAVDRAGNRAPEQTLTVALDKTGPAITVAKNEEDLVVTVDDAGAGVDEGNVTVFWSNEETSPSQFTALRMTKVTGNSFRATLPNETGTIWYYLRALDAIGNVGTKHTSAAPARVGGVVDPNPGENTAPTLVITKPAAGATVSRPVSIEWTTSDPDPDDAVTVTIAYSKADGTGGDTIATDVLGTLGEFPWTASTVEDGAYVLTLRASDGDAVTERTVSVTIKRDKVVQILTNPAPLVEEGQPANFAAEISASKPVASVVAEIVKGTEKVGEVPMTLTGGVYAGQYVPTATGRYFARITVKYTDGTSEPPVATTPFTVEGEPVEPPGGPLDRPFTTQLLTLAALSVATILASAYAAFVRWKK